jgi:ribosomal protein S8
MNKYDVIQLDIADIRTELGTSTNIAAHIAHIVIDDLKEYYGEYIRPEDKTLPTVLMNIYLKTGTEFIILIDEWDAIFRDDKYDDKSQREYIDLLRGLFKGERSMSFTALAYITGILPIKRYNSESALNNFYEFTMTAPDTITRYIGFTEDEVERLCDKYNMDFDEMKRWYDGYNLRGIHVYNPKSVTEAIQRRNYGNYWSNTVAFDSIQEYIGMDYDGLKGDIVALLSGNRRSVNIRKFSNDMTKIKSKDDVLTLLIHLGYLSYDPNAKEVYVPNEEVRSSLADTISDMDWAPVINALKRSDRLLKLTWAKEAEEVAEYISQVHMDNTSILQYNDENSLSCAITLAYYNAINDYTIVREMPAGLGFADIVYIPKHGCDKPAMVVELKYNQKAKTAIEQIKAKQYPKSLEKYKGNLLLVGINYDKNTKEHTCKIEEVDM